MAKIDKINAFGTTYNVAANSEDVAYNGDNVNNVEEAIDELYERTEEGGGGDTTVVSAAPYFRNGKLPVWKDNLKILFIANSFVQRSFCWELVNVLNGINAANPNNKITGDNLKIEQFFRGGESLAGFLQWLKTETSWERRFRITYDSGSGEWGLSELSNIFLKDLIRGENWDVIILQAFPKGDEDDKSYASYSSALKEWIYELRRLCPNPSVCIGFNMTWPQNTNKATYNTYYNRIVSAVKEMVSDSGVNLIIPSGTAMADAINTDTFNGDDTSCLLRDGTHVGKGVGEYIVACTIYEAVLAPVLKRSMMNITAVPPVNTGDSGANTYPQANIPVSAENLGLCHQIALRAVCDMYNVDSTIGPIQS